MADYRLVMSLLLQGYSYRQIEVMAACSHRTIAKANKVLDDQGLSSSSDQIGRPSNPEYVSRRFGEIVTAANLPRITVKQLRHSHATALLAAGESPKVVQERLGHASITTTLDIYSAVLPNMQRQAIDRLAAMMDGR